ncbi:MAG: DNA-binding domain-containing protein [Pseudomonadota bacterium]
MPLENQQAAFAGALLDPDLPVPAGVVDPGGKPAPKRFAVYRNNVTVSLVEALATAFPVIQKIVGEEFFAAMAREFVRQSPPSTPLLMLYGEDFPGFIEQFGPVSHLPYLASVARLEQYRREAYHAADADPLPPDFLSAIPAEALGTAVFALHPSVRLLGETYPALSLWEWNTTADQSTQPDLPEHGEAVLIARPELTVEMRRLPPGGLDFLAALAAGQPLGMAAEAGAADPDFDLTHNITGLIESRIVTHYSLHGAQQ